MKRQAEQPSLVVAPLQVDHPVSDVEKRLHAEFAPLDHEDATGLVDDVVSVGLGGRDGEVGRGELPFDDGSEADGRRRPGCAVRVRISVFVGHLSRFGCSSVSTPGGYRADTGCSYNRLPGNR